MNRKLEARIEAVRRAGDLNGEDSLGSSCELAEEQIDVRSFDAARASVVEAIGHASNNPRTSLILGRLNLESGDAKEAITTLERILEQDPMYIGESLPLLRRAHDEA